MRVVIDTGVFVSAAIKAQAAPSIAVHRAAQSNLLLKSGSTEAELMEVIDRPYLAWMRGCDPVRRGGMMSATKRLVGGDVLASNSAGTSTPSHSILKRNE